MKSCSVKKKVDCIQSLRCKWKDSKCKSKCKNTHFFNFDSRRCKKKPEDGTIQPMIKKRISDKNCQSFKFLGSGVYGCVVIPSIQTNNKVYENNSVKISKSKDIGKVFKKEKSFYKELKIAKLINKIDPKHTFTTEMISASKIPYQTIKCNSKLTSCLNPRPYQNYYQLVYEYGGVDLYQPFNLKYKDFLFLFTKFVRGMLILSKIGYVHWDIKKDNVVIKKRKISLIDFGLMVRAKDIFNGEYNLENHSGYPSEFKIANKYIERNIHLKNASAFEEYTNYLLENHYISEDLQKFLIKNKKKQFYEVFTKEIALKGDVYAISFILEELYRRVKDIAYEDRIFFENLIQKCRDKNPQTRYDMMKLYNSLVSKIKTLKTKGGSNLFMNSTYCFKSDKV